jgi:NHL repeat
VHRYRYLAAALLLAASACSSHGSSGMLPQTSSATSPIKPSSGKTAAALSIKVPRLSASASSNRRAPQYVSPSSTQLVVAVNNATPVTYALTPQSPGCSVQVTTLICTFSVAAPAGQDAFTLTLEDAGGNALSKNTVSAKLTAGQSTPVNVTLAGIPVAVQVVAGPGAHVEGTGNPSWHLPGMTPEDVEAQPIDADGNVIIGAGAPKITQVSVTTGSGFATVAPAGNPLDPEAYVLTPTGGSAAGQTVTVSATAQGVTLNDGTTSAPITSSTNFTFTPAIAVGSGPFITIYSVETGNQILQFCVVCSAIVPVTAMASDSNGELYVAVTGGFFSRSSTIFIYRPGATSPSSSLVTSNGIGLVNTLTTDKNGMLYVGSGQVIRGPSPQIQEFPKGATTASVTITGGVTSPSALGVDGSGNVYSVDNGSVNIYGPGSQAGPTQTITDPSFVQPAGIGVDSTGDFYVSDTGNATLDYFSSGSTSVTSFLTDPSFNNWGGSGTLMFDPSGNLWTAISNPGELERLDANSLPGSVFAGEFIATNAQNVNPYMAWIP